MTMWLKEGVTIEKLTPQMLLGLVVIFSIFQERGITMVVTSCCDGKHMDKSKHYEGNAADIRLPSRFTSLSVTDGTMVRDIRAHLPGFDVVLESDHIHVEYDPKSEEGVG